MSVRPFLLLQQAGGPNKHMNFAGWGFIGDAPCTTVASEKAISDGFFDIGPYVWFLDLLP